MYQKQTIPTKAQVEKLLREGSTLSNISAIFGLYNKKTRQIMNGYGLHENIYYEKFLGQKYGLLTILEIWGIRNDRTAKCQCECGEIVECMFYTLTSGHIKSCKKKVCQNKFKQKPSVYISKYILLNYWNRLLYAAKRRKLEITITPEYLDDLWEKQGGICGLSGIEILIPKRNPYYRKEMTMSTASLDRIDSNQGYIPGNVIWVHKDINRMKLKLSNQQFIGLCKEVYNALQKN